MEKELAKKTLKNLQKNLHGLRYGNYNTLKVIEKAAASVEVDGLSETTLDLMWKESRRPHTNLFENLYNSVSDYIAELLSALHVYKVCPNLYEGNDRQEALARAFQYKKTSLEIDGEQWDIKLLPLYARIEGFLNYIGDCRVKMDDYVCREKGATLRIFRYGDDCGKSALRSAVLTYDGDEDIVFHLWDWQGDYPKSMEEVKDYEWTAGDSGVQAIMFNGMPKILG